MYLMRKQAMANYGRWIALISLTVVVAFGVGPATAQTQRVFASPEAAVLALVEAARSENAEGLLAIFGPEGRSILSSGDPVADRNQREVILVAFGEGWKLVDAESGAKEVVIGNEAWPFPIPLVKEGAAWRFDAAAGAEEILARRIGRNELSVIQICQTYVEAQYVYARVGHDGKPAGLYAQKIRSDAGKQDGLYWPAKEGEKLSPLGELAARAAEEGYKREEGDATPMPFHGYYFRILTAQGAAAPGGAASYIRNGAMTGGFALVAWPAQYGNSGVMTFLVNQDGVVYEKDLGDDTAATAPRMTEYNPDESWAPVE